MSNPEIDSDNHYDDYVYSHVFVAIGGHRPPKEFRTTAALKGVISKLEMFEREDDITIDPYRAKVIAAIALYDVASKAPSNKMRYPTHSDSAITSEMQTNLIEELRRDV